MIYGRYLPNRVVVGFDPTEPAVQRIPLLEGRYMIDGRSTAYVCERYACQQPVTTPEGLAEQLGPMSH